MDLASKKGVTGPVNDDYGLGDETSLPYDTKYLKVTLDQAFAESAEDIFLGLIDNEQCLDFTVCVNNFKFQNLSLVSETFRYDFTTALERGGISDLPHRRRLHRA